MAPSHARRGPQALAFRALPMLVAVTLIASGCATSDPSASDPPAPNTTADTGGPDPSDITTTTTPPPTQTTTGSSIAPTEVVVESRLLEGDCPALASGSETLDMLIWGIRDDLASSLPQGERTWEAVVRLLEGIGTRSPVEIADHLAVITGRLSRVSELYKDVDVTNGQALYETDPELVSRVWVIRQSEQYSESFDVVSDWVGAGCPSSVDVSVVEATAPPVNVGTFADGGYTGFGRLTGPLSTDAAGVVRALALSPQGLWGFVELGDSGVRHVSAEVYQTEVGGQLAIVPMGVSGARDGSVWMVAEGDTGDGTFAVGLAQWRRTGWRFFELPPDISGCEAASDDQSFCDFSIISLAVGPDDAVWITGADFESDPPRIVVARFDGSTWQDFSAGAQEYAANIRISGDGTAWTRTAGGGDEVASLANGTWNIRNLGRSINVLEPLDDGGVVVGGADYIAILTSAEVTQIAPGAEPYGTSVGGLFPGADTETDTIRYVPRAIVPTPDGRIVVLFQANWFRESAEASTLLGSEGFLSAYGPQGWALFPGLDDWDSNSPEVSIAASSSGDILIAVADEKILRIPMP